MDTAQAPKYKRVMIIDDNKIDRYVIEMVVKKGNFSKEVVQTESGIEALEYLEAHDENGWPDVILLDINMPGMNGFEFMDKYATFPEALTSSCAVYMLTTSIHPLDIDKAINNKYIIKFINKPLNMARLKELHEGE